MVLSVVLIIDAFVRVRLHSKKNQPAGGVWSFPNLPVVMYVSYPFLDRYENSCLSPYWATSSTLEKSFFMPQASRHRISFEVRK
jgi:hypothetical protein